MHVSHTNTGVKVGGGGGGVECILSKNFLIKNIDSNQT